jgi:hypothetical protein
MAYPAFYINKYRQYHWRSDHVIYTRVPYIYYKGTLYML